MNAFSGDQFGDMSSLLQALGLVDASGEFNNDWIASPEDYLKTVLADDDQRAALMTFVSTVRGGEIERDADGRQWIELFAEDIGGGQRVVFHIVMDDQPAAEVHLFFGFRLETGAPLAESASSLLFPLFRAAKEGHPAPSSPELVGHPGGRIAVTAEVTVSASAPPPGEAGLRAVGLRLSVPTAAGDRDPEIGLSLRGLQLPGESSARDLVLSLTDPEAIRDAGLELILGLLQGQVGSATGAQIRALARLIGLGNDPQIPDLPFEDIVSRGADALADWLATALGDAARRATWLQALADLLANGASVDGDGVMLPVGTASIRIGLAAVPGAAGRPVVTLSVGIGFADGGAEVALAADLVRLDLGTGDATAVPSLRAEARFDLSGAAMPDVSVDALAVGFGLNEVRRPVLLIVLENATIFGTQHDRLDLTNPDALAAAAVSAATDALSELLGQIGPAGDLISVALGWAPPDGAGAGYPTIDLLAFLGDPLGALKAHWLDVLEHHAGDAPKALAALRQLLTGDATPGAVTGSGTAAAPWLLPLVAGLHVAVWRDAGGRLVLALGFSTRVDTLGERCTVIETRFRLAIVALDLAGGGASFIPELSARFLGRARGGGRLGTDQGGLRLEVDHIGIAALWAPDDGLDVQLDAPNPRLLVDGVGVPLDLPDLTGGFDDMLASITEAQWDSLERIVALLAERLEVGWLADLIDALGWRRATPIIGTPEPNRLSLAALVDDAEGALRHWLAGLIASAELNGAAVSRRLQPLARLLSGRATASANIAGSGTIADPWRIELDAAAGLPALAVWREPDRPLPIPDYARSIALRLWRPGAAGLDAVALAEAILTEFPDLAGPFGAGLAPDALSNGLMALAELWQGSDGLSVPLAAPPAGTTQHVVENRTAAEILEGIDPAEFLGGPAPGTVIFVSVQPDGTPVDAALDPAHLLDMREAGRDPLAFTPLPATAGTWHVLLAPRADARLASGDPDGVRGQVARLKHALSQIAGVADSVVVADAAAGHAAWLALDEMGPGLDRLVAVGLPVEPAQVPPVLSPAAGEVLRRLDEFLPAEDPAEPDDADLAAARRLLGARIGAHAFAVADLALPAGWTGARRPDLEVHVVHGRFDAAAVARAMTAAAASGLSLAAQVRDVRRAAERITSASFGGYLPLRNTAASGGLEVDGHVLAEVLGIDLDTTGPLPAAHPRDARRVAAALELRRREGWLIGGPGAAERPLDLELRSVEIGLQIGIGGAAPGLDRVEVILHGVRIRDRSFPRLVLRPGLADADLGIDGQAAPTTPEIEQLLTRVLTEAVEGTATELRQVADALRSAGVLGTGGDFDALSLSNWIDDPAARLSQLLANPSLRSTLVGLVGELAGAHSGLGFDAAAGRLTVSLSGSTNEPVLGEWSLSAAIDRTGIADGTLRLGETGGTHLAVTLRPFAASLRLASDQAAALGGLPAEIPVWPAPNLRSLEAAGLPALAAVALSRMLEGLRNSDPAVQPLIDAAATAFGLLRPLPGGGDRVAIPPLAFADPGRWLRQDTVFGAGGGVSLRADRVIAALDALKPLLGVSGPAGVWQIDSGIELRARASDGVVLEIAIDPAQFLPAGPVAFGGAFGLHYGTDGRVLPALAAFVGLPGGTSGTQAVHLTVAGSDVTLFLRPGSGGDIGIYPDVGGLAQLATAGVIAALPAALDAIVATGSDAGNLVADIGDALLLRTGGSFDGAAISAWATDPAGTLEARWPALIASGLSRLGPALPSGISVTTPGGAVRLEVQDAGTPGSTVSVEFNPSPVWVELGASITAIPFVQQTSATLRFDATGLARLHASVGPADIPMVDAIRLHPVVEIEVGSAVGDPFFGTGLAVDAANTRALMLRYSFNSESFDLGFASNTPEEIAAGIMHFAVDLIGSFLMDLDPVEEILDLGVGATGTVRSVLTDVVLTPAGALDAEFFRVIPNPGESASALLDSKLDRVMTLIHNVAEAQPSVRVGGELDIGLGASGGVIGLSLGLANRLAIVDGDIMLWLENDSRWIIGTPPAGIEIGFLRIVSGSPQFEPTLSVNGLGLRVGRRNAPLIDSPLSLGSIALHLFGRIGTAELLGGAQVQLAEIGAAVGGAEGGNPVAQGMLAETNDGDASLAPAFSPAFSVQTRPAAQGGGIAFRFVAGEGEGPWWLPIRSQFGPIYIDQVGLGTQMADDQLQSISILFDGNVSIAGLQAAVDDLELRYRLDQGGIFEPSSWSVDLAGLAISADLSGVTLAGGLRKFGTPGVPENVEYIGMLTARFAAYGLSIYGGYASVEAADRGRFTAFFAFGAIIGPIGGPPAFFLTGIGGGFGINRDIVPPSDMDRFDEFVLIAALDPAAEPPSDLMAYMAEIRETFPAVPDRFWFAAGISFTSFTLVDGIAVVAIEFGQGFELSIFGLARMALPRPQVALVSIELGLMARFSTEEGVIWIQAQLTDNSWLLHRSARLTGGFAYVSWFKGPNAGQFVLTLGGYHPNFHAEGYPQVPRLGLNWSVGSNITIKAETYFALTSEAVMGGGLFEASAKFGPAFAHLSFGGNAIVYFDPFHYEADAHARISAGIRIETWFGTIKLSFTLGAAIEVQGPEFHGKARIEVGPIDVTVRFGDSSPVPADYISWTEFVTKYLELAPGNQAQALSGIAGRGALPPASGSGEEEGTADGSAAHPFDVISEFELSFTTTIPISRINRAGTPIPRDPTGVLGIAPMNRVLHNSTWNLSLKMNGSGGERLNAKHLDGSERIVMTTRDTGAFPVGVWGPAPDLDNKKVPKGKVIGATEGIDLRFVPALIGRIPHPSTGGIAFNQVEAGPRKPLPLRAAGRIRAELVREGRVQREIIAGLDSGLMPAFARDWHASGRSDTSRRSWLREHAAPMRIGLLSERIVGTSPAGRKSVIERAPGKFGSIAFGDAKIRGVLTQPVRASASSAAVAGTTIRRSAREVERLPRVLPPTIAGVLSEREGRVATALLRARLEAPTAKRTVVARQQLPETFAQASGISAGAGRAAPAEKAMLDGISAMMLSGPQARRPKDGAAPRPLAAGEIAVFDLPGAASSPRFKTSGTLRVRGTARLVAIGLDGRVTLNMFPAKPSVELPARTRAFAVLAGPEAGAEAGDEAGEAVAGWVEGTSLAYLGQSVARCRGGFVTAEGASRARGGRAGATGWLRAGALTDQSSLVETRFDRGAEAVAILLDGTVTDADLAELSVSFSGAELSEDRPLLVPFDGKTLVVYRVLKSDNAGKFAVVVAGAVPGRLDGAIAARMSPERLVSRIVNDALNLDVETVAARRDGPVRAQWYKPADIEPVG